MLKLVVSQTILILCLISTANSQLTCDVGTLKIINFDQDASGNNLLAGTILDDQYATIGMNISTVGSKNTSIIFDSSKPTGDDPDLGTPNEDFGGPGKGTGGESGKIGANTQALGKVLIIAENIKDARNNVTLVSGADGLVDVPDDSTYGGKVYFDFDFPVKILALDVLDIDGSEDFEIEGLDGDGDPSFPDKFAAAYGNNSYQRVIINESGFNTVTLKTTFDSASGAIAQLAFCVPETDCLGVVGGTAKEDACGVCEGPGKNACNSCDPTVVDLGCGCGNEAPDACGTCDGSITDVGCGCGNPNKPDLCGSCDPDNVCGGSCDDLDITDNQLGLDGLNLDQSNFINSLSREFVKNGGGKVYAKKIKADASKLYQTNWQMIWSIASQLKTDCVNTTCIASSNITNLSLIEQNTLALSTLSNKLIKRLTKLGVTPTARINKYKNKNQSFINTAVGLIKGIPQVNFFCS